AQGSSVLTVAANGSAATGTFSVTVTGTSGSLTATTVVAVTVISSANFALSATPGSLAIAQGTGATTTIAVTPLNGFGGNVNLTASGLPSGVTASFIPNPTATNSTLTLSAGDTAATGTFAVTVTGTSGGLTNTTTISLTVMPAPNF